MNQETLMNKLLEGQENIKDKLHTIDVRTVTLEQTVNRHDVETFPDMKRDITETKHAVVRMESKQNEDMAVFIKEKERVYNELNERLKPLEEERKARNAVTADIKKKVWDATWEWLKLAIVALTTWLITQYHNIN